MWDVGLDESQAGIKIDRRSINNLRCAYDTTLKAKSEEELTNVLTKVKPKIMVSGPITSQQTEGEKVEAAKDYFLGLQNHCGQWL